MHMLSQLLLLCYVEGTILRCIYFQKALPFCNKCDNNSSYSNNKKGDKQAPPFRSLATTRFLISLINLYISLLDMIVGYLCVVLNTDDRRLLPLHGCIEVLENLPELDYLTLNTMDC
jgi:hypothetical protein